MDNNANEKTQTIKAKNTIIATESKPFSFVFIEIEKVRMNAIRSRI